MEHLSPCIPCKLYRSIYFVWGDFVDSDGHQLGQASSAVVKAQIQTTGNLEEGLSNCDCVMDCVGCLCSNTLLEFPSNNMVQLFNYITVFSLIDCLFCENFSCSPSSTNPRPEPNSPRTVKRCKSTEHGALQKGSIECPMGAVGISYLLSTHKHSGRFYNSWIVPICCYC